VTSVTTVDPPVDATLRNDSYTNDVCERTANV